MEVLQWSVMFVVPLEKVLPQTKGNNLVWGLRDCKFTVTTENAPRRLHPILEVLQVGGSKVNGDRMSICPLHPPGTRTQVGCCGGAGRRAPGPAAVGSA